MNASVMKFFMMNLFPHPADRLEKALWLGGVHLLIKILISATLKSDL